MKFSRILFPCLFSLALLSCATPGIQISERPALPHADFVIQSIEEQLAFDDDEHYLQAAALLSREFSRSVLDQDALFQLYEALLDGYMNLDGSSGSPSLRQQQNFNDLLAQYRNWGGQKNYDSFTVPEQWEILLEEAEAFRSEGNETLALHYIARIVDEEPSGILSRGLLNREQLDWYAKVSREHNNRQMLALLMEALERNYPLNPDDPQYAEYRQYLQRSWETQIGVDASVTIWVDMGIVIENRIGYPQRSIGTGFYISSDGYIITNYHVIASEVDKDYEGKSELFIRPGDNPSLRIPARVVGYDKIFDIALLKAETQAPEYLSLQNSSSLRTGSALYAVGSPGGLENTVTSGIVSSIGRRFLQMGDALQIDVPVNPGNSGGPLFDAQGRLVGVVYAGIEQYEGVNFAIPGQWIQYLLPQLFDGGEVQHPWLGVSLREDSSGLEVIYIVPGSAAEQSGLQVGDVISGIDGHEIRSIPEAQELLLREGLDRLFALDIVDREGARSTRLVPSRERPFLPMEHVLGPQLVDTWLPPLFGMQVRAISSGNRVNEFQITEVYPGGVADESGLSERDSFQLMGWYYDADQQVAIIQMYVQKKTGAYIREGLQLANYIELTTFL